MEQITVAGISYEKFITEPHKITFVDIDNNSDASNSISLSRVLPANPTGSAKARFKFQSDVAIDNGQDVDAKTGRVYVSLDITAPAELSTAQRTTIINDFVTALADTTVLACLQKGVL